MPSFLCIHELKPHTFLWTLQKFHSVCFSKLFFLFQFNGSSNSICSLFLTWAFIENAIAGFPNTWGLSNILTAYWSLALIQEHILHYFNNLKLWAFLYDFTYRLCWQNQCLVGYVLFTSWLWCIECVIMWHWLVVLLKFSVFLYFIVLLLSSVIETMLQSSPVIWRVDSLLLFIQ